VISRRERFRLLGRNGRVAWDENRHHATERLDSERQRRHVEQQYILLLAGENCTLNRRADRDHFVGIDALVGLLAEELLDLVLNLRNTRRATDEKDLVDLVGLNSCILQRLLHRRNHALDEVVDELLELG